MKKQAFTLIELLVVVLIIGILAAIALPKYEVAVEKSRASEALINLKHAQESYVINHLQTSGDFLQKPAARDITELSGGHWNSDGVMFCTDKFLYELDDYTNPLIAYRCVPREDCNNCTNDAYEYALRIGHPYMPASEGNWEEIKTCEAYTDLGYKICKNLEGQGFETDDQRS